MTSYRWICGDSADNWHFGTFRCAEALKIAIECGAKHRYKEICSKSMLAMPSITSISSQEILAKWAYKRLKSRHKRESHHAIMRKRECREQISSEEVIINNRYSKAARPNAMRRSKTILWNEIRATYWILYSGNMLLSRMDCRFR